MADKQFWPNDIVEEDIPPAQPLYDTAMWEDFIDVFYAPREVFLRRAQANAFIPILVVTAMMGVIFLAASGVMEPILDAEFSRGAAAAMRQNPNISLETMQRYRDMGAGIGKVFIFFVTPIQILLTAISLWLVGRLFDAKQTVGAALIVTAYAWIPRVVGSLVGSVEALLMDPGSLTGIYKLSLGAARFLDPETASPMALALLGRVEVFTIWTTVLLAIGLMATGKLSGKQATVAGILMWLVGALPGVLGALRQM